jgi:hypothetical protein
MKMNETLGPLTNFIVIYDSVTGEIHRYCNKNQVMEIIWDQCPGTNKAWKIIDSQPEIEVAFKYWVNPETNAFELRPE